MGTRQARQPHLAGAQRDIGEQHRPPAQRQRADGCCVFGQDAEDTPSVPDAWFGQIPFGTTTTHWQERYGASPNFYQGTIAVRMWVDPAAPNLLDTLLPPKPAAGQPIPRAPVGALPLCGRPVMLTDVTLRGREVRLAGLARPDYAGRPVTITAAGRVVARATAAPGGRFSATIRRTANSARLRYEAHVADARSPALKANRLLIIDSQSPTRNGLRVRGHLISRRRAHRTLSVVRQLGCSATRTTRARTVRTDRRGRFSVTLPAPPASERFAVYRLRTTSGGTTYTLPLVLRTPSAAAG